MVNKQLSAHTSAFKNKWFVSKSTQQQSGYNNLNISHNNISKALYLQINRVIIKIHFLPKRSESKPTGTIVDAASIPIKYIAPINPILYLDSQSIDV